MNIVVPCWVENIEFEAFHKCPNLKTVTIESQYTDACGAVIEECEQAKLVKK